MSASESYKKYRQERAAAIEENEQRRLRFVNQWPVWFKDVPCGFYLPEEWEPLMWITCTCIEWEMQQAGVDLNVMEVQQVKEKFWGLRFYYSLADLGKSPEAEKLRAKIHAMTSLAESLSIAGPFRLPQLIERGKKADDLTGQK